MKQQEQEKEKEKEKQKNVRARSSPDGRRLSDEKRDAFVRQHLIAERAANEAKTARLRKARLEKEHSERSTAG